MTMVTSSSLDLGSNYAAEDRLLTPAAIWARYADRHKALNIADSPPTTTNAVPNKIDDNDADEGNSKVRISASRWSIIPLPQAIGTVKYFYDQWLAIPRLSSSSTHPTTALNPAAIYSRSKCQAASYSRQNKKSYYIKKTTTYPRRRFQNGYD